MSSPSNNSNVREKALLSLRGFLEMLLGPALVRWRPVGPGEGWPSRMDWPAPSGNRDLAWKQLRGRLEAEGRASEVEVWPDGATSGRPAAFDWPDAQMLLAFPGGPAREQAAGQRESQNGILSLGTSPPPLTQDEEDVEIRVVRRPSKASRVCAALVLLTLYREQKRMTCRELVSQFEGTPQEYSQSAVEATCSWLIERGDLTNGRDRLGRGYGLTRWDRSPPESVGEEVEDES